MLMPNRHLCKVKTALKEESSPQHAARRTVMAEGKMCDREVSFLSQTLGRAGRRNSTAVSGVTAALLMGLADPAAALTANAELSSLLHCSR